MQRAHVMRTPPRGEENEEERQKSLLGATNEVRMWIGMCRSLIGSQFAPNFIQMPKCT